MDGIVKWFNEHKGYGFIVDENGDELFAHYSEIQGEGYKILIEDEIVSFETAQSANGMMAIGINRKSSFSPEKNVALIYSDVDDEIISKLFYRLRIKNIYAFCFNEHNLLGSDHAENEAEDTWTINDVSSNVDIIILCISSEALKSPYFRNVIEMIDPYTKETRNSPPLFILKVEDCDMSEQFEGCEDMDLSKPDGFSYMIQRLRMHSLSRT
jgi:CspA family cold shock protein